MQRNYLTNIQKWLEKPFPFYETYQQKIFIPIALTFFVMVGIILFNWTTNYDVLWKQIGNVLTYGSIVIFISLIFSLVLPEIFPNVFHAEKWNVLKTLVSFTLAILAIGLAITLFAYNFDNQNNIPFISFFTAVIVRSVLLSFFPIIIMVFYFENLLHKRNHIEALKMIDEINKEKPDKDQNQTFTFAKNTKDEIQINEHDLYYIKAEGNYCNVVYSSGLEFSHKLIRSSLKEIEMCINQSGNFIRCHKSYIVNLSKISNVTGNARGYLFHLANYNDKIPGSRNLSKSLIDKIKTVPHT